MTDRHDPYVSLRNHNFRWFVASLVAMTLATMVQGTVVAWQVYALTRDPLSLGLVGLAEAIPFIGAALAPGRYAVTWRTMSHDGHAMRGTYHFTVAAAGHDHH